MYSTILNVACLGTDLGGYMAISLLTFLYNNIIMAQARGNSNKSIYQPIHPREASMTFQGVKENRESRAIPYGRHLEPFLSFFQIFLFSRTLAFILQVARGRNSTVVHLSPSCHSLYHSYLRLLVFSN